MAYQGMISPEKLPPTARTAHFHGLRVHYQIMQWLLLNEDVSLNPCDWGWVQKQNKLLPITTDSDVAPPSLKDVIRCKCNLNTKNPCGTGLCTCRRFGMVCLPSCGGCHGDGCNNSDLVAADETSFEDMK